MPLTQRQMEYLALAWQCFETEPKINYEKFAEAAGLSNARSASELMRMTKNKLKTEYGALSGNVKTSNNARTPKKANGTARTTTPGSGTGMGRKRGTKAKAAEEDDEEMAGHEESPTKKIKGGGAKEEKVEVKMETAEEDAEDENWA